MANLEKKRGEERGCFGGLFISSFVSLVRRFFGSSLTCFLGNLCGNRQEKERKKVKATNTKKESEGRKEVLFP